MLNSVKEILTKEIDIPDIFDKEIDMEAKQVRDFLVQEIEIKKLKELLATEVKLKEFLVQEIDVKKLFANSDQERIDKEDAEYKPIGEAISTGHSQVVDPKTTTKKSKVGTRNKAITAKESSLGSKKLPPYDSTLIKTLEEEQADLMFIYKEMMKNAELEEYNAVAGRLEAFSSKIKAHFHKADKELYSYLRKFIQLKYPKRERAFNELNLEMKNISIEIFFSITQSPFIPVNENNREDFIKEFSHVGELLETRIHREETVLHVMYDESNSATNIS